MSRFVDVYISNQIRGWPCNANPRFSTRITETDSGAEQANRRWLHPLYTYTLPEAIRAHEHYEAIRDHWLVMGGPAQTWPWRDPLDFASVALESHETVPEISATDQDIGVGDGAQSRFQLTKTYARESASYTRPINLPIVSTVLVSIDDNPPADLGLTWTVTRPGGIVIFSGPVPPGGVVKAGFLFDVEVRFESDDSFDGIAKTYGVSGLADLKLTGVRSC